MFKPVDELVIDCNTWFRGKVSGYKDSKLLTRDRKLMCCLGFECRARGVSMERLRCVDSPDSLAKLLGTNIPCMTLSDSVYIYDNTPVIYDAMRVNDDEHSSDEYKMKELKRLFKMRGIKLRFINIPGIKS